MVDSHVTPGYSLRIHQPKGNLFMPQVITRMKSLPPQAQLVAAKMGMLGFEEGSWRYEMNTPLASPLPSESLQVRNIKDRAPKMRVGHYVEILKPYTLNRANMLMPPVIVTDDGFLLDGNTRTEAARRLGWQTFPALVLNDRWNGAPQALQDQMMKLATMFNTTHGKDLAPGEIERLVLLLAREDTSAANLARQLQVSRTTVKNVLYSKGARERAAELGIDVNSEKITRSHLSNLGIQAEKLTDPVFAAILNLVLKTGLNANEERALITALGPLRTEQDKLERIAAERASLDGVAKGYATKPSTAARMRQALGNVNNHSAGDLVETNPVNGKMHAEVIETAIGRLEDTLRLQQKLNSERG